MIMIEKDKAIEAVHRDANPFLEYAASQLRKLPTIEIVRCWECKWWELTPDNTKLPDWHRCRFYGTIHTRVDEFCSRGERNG